MFVTAVCLAVIFFLPGLWVSYLAEGLALTTIFLSITVLVGIGGQISLCQASFAGLGAFTAGQLATRWDFPLYAGIIVGALVAAALGVLIALPCIRLGGLYLALGTLAFALMLQNTLFVESWLTGSEGGVDVPRPLIGSIDFADDRAFFFFAFAVFAICGFAVVLLRRGTTGQYLAALRGSEVAATAVGINPIRAKVTVFAVSAAIAGAGGALYASYLETARVDDFNAIQGLFWVLLVVTLGSAHRRRRAQRGHGVRAVAAAARRHLPRAVRLGRPDPVRAVRVRRGDVRPASRGHRRVPEASEHREVQCAADPLVRAGEDHRAGRRATSRTRGRGRE